MKSERLGGGGALLGCGSLLAVVFVIVLCAGSVEYGFQHDITGTVTSTYVKRHGEGHDRFYVVIRDDAGRTHVVENRDTVLWGKWDSADVQARLSAGCRVRVRVSGVRVQFMSWFPNVVRLEVLEDAPEPR